MPAGDGDLAARVAVGQGHGRQAGESGRGEPDVDLEWFDRRGRPAEARHEGVGEPARRLASGGGEADDEEEEDECPQAPRVEARPGRAGQGHLQGTERGQGPLAVPLPEARGQGVVERFRQPVVEAAQRRVGEAVATLDAPQRLAAPDRDIAAPAAPSEVGDAGDER